MVERGKNVLFYSALVYIDRKKIFRQPEPELFFFFFVFFCFFFFLFFVFVLFLFFFTSS